MNNRNLLSAIVFLSTILSSVNTLAEINMGVFPRLDVESTRKAFQPLADHLSKQLGEKVNLIVPDSFKAFWMGVKKNQFDLVHFNQYHYIRSHKELGYRVIVANEEFGNRQITGSLSVRKDSGINSVADLRGKVILFGGSRKAMSSFIAPTAMLKKAGLQADKDYLVNFASNPPSAVAGVYNNGASAAGAGNVVMRISATTKKINVDEMKIIAESEPFTQLPWAVSKNVSSETEEKIRAVMTGLKYSTEGKAVLNSANVTDFFAVTDKDYDKVREITRYALDEKY